MLLPKSPSASEIMSLNCKINSPIESDLVFTDKVLHTTNEGILMPFGIQKGILPVMIKITQLAWAY